MLDLSCRDLVEALWYFKECEDKVLVNGQHIRRWARDPQDRRGEQWAGGKRNCHFGKGREADDGGNILEASHCGQRRRPRLASVEAPALERPDYKYQRGGRRWVVRYKRTLDSNDTVWFSLGSEESSEACVDAQIEAEKQGLQLCLQVTNGWFERRGPEQTCVPCRKDGPSVG